MDNLIDPLIAAVSAIGAAVTAWFTVVLARLTKSLATEARRTNERLARAEIVLAVESNPRFANVIELVIKNVGAAPARQVEVKAPAKFIRPRGGDPDRKDLAISLSVILPGAATRVFLDLFTALGRDAVVEASSTYTDELGFHSVAVIQPLAGLAQISVIRASPVEEAAEKLSRLADDLRGAVTGFNHLKVDVRTAADRRREQED